ncbi:MAG: 30S ribosome-binding factor RbfA [Candidatus Algichlamydia australiensis]|nr:30S ribosome-binding factor RbfA [Chlamydiales bacterium]
MTRRTERLNSLLKEVISEVIRNEVRNPKIAKFTTVMSVSITKDLRHAKIYVSILGDEKERSETINGLNSAASFIAISTSKKVVMRFFPELTFHLDTSTDDLLHIDNILGDLEKEREARQ